MKLLRMFALLAFSLTALPIAAQQLPESPKPKPDRRIFWAGVAVLASSKTADAITTRRLLDNGGWENSRIYGRHPSPAVQAGINAGLFAAEVGAFYLTEHSRYRWIRWTGRTYIALLAVDHADAAACNAAVNPHSPVVQNCYPLLPLY